MSEENKTKSMAIDFYGRGLSLYSVEGEPYVAMKPIVEELGLKWNGQQVKIRNDERYAAICIPLPTPGGIQEMVCLPLRRLNTWLFSVSPRRVKPELRRHLQLYQDECSDALYRYWHDGVVVNPRAVNEATKKLSLKEVQGEFEGALGLARLVGLKDTAATIAANNAIRKRYGDDILALLEVNLKPAEQSSRYVPTEFAKKLTQDTDRIFTARAVNKLLEDVGLQESCRDHKNRIKWVLTNLALDGDSSDMTPYAEYVATGKEHSNGTPVLQIKWLEKTYTILLEHVLASN